MAVAAKRAIGAVTTSTVAAWRRRQEAGGQRISQLPTGPSGPRVEMRGVALRRLRPSYGFDVTSSAREDPLSQNSSSITGRSRSRTGKHNAGFVSKFSKCWLYLPDLSSRRPSEGRTPSRKSVGQGTVFRGTMRGRTKSATASCSMVRRSISNTVPSFTPTKLGFL